MSNKREQIPLMPKGTAVWLKKNTKLTTDQIIKFCHLTVTDFEFLMTDHSFMSVNPISIGQLTKEEIARCEANPDTQLRLCCQIPTRRNVTVRYLDKRQKEVFPSCVLWMTQNTKCTPEVIGKILGRGPKFILKTIEKNKVEPVTPCHPVESGRFCDHDTLLKAIRDAEKVEYLPACVKWMTENTKCSIGVIGELLGKDVKSITRIIERNKAEPVSAKNPVEYGRFCDEESLSKAMSEADRTECLAECVKWMRLNTRCSEPQIAKLLSITKSTISSIEEKIMRAHGKNPIEYGFCHASDLTAFMK